LVAENTFFFLCTTPRWRHTKEKFLVPFLSRFGEKNLVIDWFSARYAGMVEM